MIDWVSFLIVFVVSLVAASAVVALYSLGIRFLATPAPVLGPNGPARDDENDDVDDIGRPLWATVAANVCFALSIIMVIVGIYLIVPALH
ncbi:MAG TPA: hypothetical protein VLZ31_01380 [Microbacteriaceae bacterium]|nr:hypothetical protein [Microbacteriaceae bacterium]